MNGDQHDNSAYRAGAAYIFSGAAAPNLPNQLYLPLLTVEQPQR